MGIATQRPAETGPGPARGAATAAARPDQATAEIQESLYDVMSGPAVLMLGGANVIMQLARLPVGRGVAESKVESGRVDRHPVKRARTTLAYLAIAMFGTDEERAAYRREVNRSHQAVRSEPDSEVSYNAFDPDLQLWVAACIYVGAEQALELWGPDTLADDPRTREAFYRHGARFGTTLQVTEDMWPASRQEFEDYWNEGVGQIEMDDVTRGYLQEFAGLGFLPLPLARTLGLGHRFMVAGFLPARFREELGLDWGSLRRRVHKGLTGLAMTATRLAPAAIRRFPLNFYLWDTRRRIRNGKPIV